MPTGGRVATGGAASTGGAIGDGGTNTGGNEPTGGVTTTTERPCDVYATDSAPCVAAYSSIRSLSSTYTDPLCHVRSGSSAQNTGSGGELHYIEQTVDGFADQAAQHAVCGGTTCMVSLLYDHSDRGNDLPVAKRGGSTAGGEYADDDDFESIADAGPLTVGGHDVYSLYMEARKGYRVTPPNTVGDGMPLEQDPQGIYLLPDGTHAGDACRWDFGNVSPDPTRYGLMNTSFFGTA